MSQPAPSEQWLTSERNTARTSPPIMVSDCVREIRAVGGVIWLTQKLDYSILMRCTIERKQVRIVVPSPLPTAEPVADEANSQLHTVLSVDRLREWLQTVTQRL